MDLICRITDEDLGEKSYRMIDPIIRYASRGIVLNSDGKIAIFNKQKMNQYKLPGGGLEDKEDFDDAFLREVREETGCNVKIIQELGITEELKSQDNFMQISHVFVGKVIEDTKRLGLTDKEKAEGGNILWEEPKTALELISSSYEKLIASKYEPNKESVYSLKFITLRDKCIIEYFLKGSLD